MSWCPVLTDASQNTERIRDSAELTFRTTRLEKGNQILDRVTEMDFARRAVLPDKAIDLVARLVTTAGQYVNSHPQSSIHGSGDITRLVTDEPGLAQIECKLRGGVLQHSGIWLSVMVRPGVRDAVWVISARPNAIEPSTDVCQLAVDISLNQLEIIQTVVAAPNSGLVGHEYHRETQLVYFGDSLERPRNKPDVLGPMKVMRVLSDHAISIQKNGGAEGAAASYWPADAGVDSIHEETRRRSTAAQIAWYVIRWTS